MRLPKRPALSERLELRVSRPVLLALVKQAKRRELSVSEVAREILEEATRKAEKL